MVLVHFNGVLYVLFMTCTLPLGAPALLNDIFKADIGYPVKTNGVSFLGMFNASKNLDFLLINFPLLNEARKLIRSGTSATLEELGNLRSSLAVAGEKLTSLAETTVKSFETGSHKVESIIYNVTKEAKERFPLLTELKNVGSPQSYVTPARNEPMHTLTPNNTDKNGNGKLRSHGSDIEEQEKFYAIRQTTPYDVNNVGGYQGKQLRNETTRKDTRWTSESLKHESFSLQRSLEEKEESPLKMDIKPQIPFRGLPKDLNANYLMDAGEEHKKGRELSEKNGYFKMHRGITRDSLLSNGKTQVRIRKTNTRKKGGRKGVHYGTVMESQDPLLHSGFKTNPVTDRASDLSGSPYTSFENVNSLGNFKSNHQKMPYSDFGFPEGIPLNPTKKMMFSEKDILGEDDSIPFLRQSEASLLKNFDLDDMEFHM